MDQRKTLRAMRQFWLALHSKNALIEMLLARTPEQLLCSNPVFPANLCTPHNVWLGHFFRASHLRGLVSHKKVFHSFLLNPSASLTNRQTADSILCHGRSQPFASVNRNTQRIRS